MQYIFKQEVDWRLFRVEREGKSIVTVVKVTYLTVTLLKPLGYTLRRAAALEGELHVNVHTGTLSPAYPLPSTQ